MRTAILCAWLAGVFIPSAARGQSISLTEADALARLSADSPRVRAIRATVALARAEVEVVGRWPNPRLTFDRESVAGMTENMTMVAQPLPITGRRELEVRAATALVEASASRSDEALRRARLDLRTAFARLAAAQIRERELTTSRDRFRELADVLAKREAAGDAAGFDRLRAEREVLDIDADRAAASIERGRAQAILAGFFGEPVDPGRIVALDRGPVRWPLPSLDALVQRAESTRGELAALKREVDAGRFGMDAAGRRWIPEPEIVAGTKSSNAGGGDIGGVFMVHASLPIFDRGKPERAMAMARQSQAQARVDVFLVTLRAEIAGLRAALMERQELADRYRAAAVNNAREIERIAQVSYDAGERSILELLDAYRTVSSARIRQAGLDLAVRELELELEYVSGLEVQ